MLKKIVILSLTTACAFAFNYDLKPQKVSENVWCFFGKTQMPLKENGGFTVMMTTGLEIIFTKKNLMQKF
mgnify:CR=1 FL=1